MSSTRFEGGASVRSPASTAALVATWLFLVAVAVAGRSWQPVLHATPLAAVALAAGAALPGTLLAASVPVVALLIGDRWLPPHESLMMAIIVYAALSWPVLIGRLGLLGDGRRQTRWLNVLGAALVSSLPFFFVTNTAHWALTDQYPKTAQGLLASLAAGLPFHRWMVLGDVVWSLAVFGCLAAATAGIDALAARRVAPARVPSGRDGPGPRAA